MNRLIEVRPHVREALEAGGPVVALESTVIAHGLPKPHNIETALAMERAVIAQGATPATIALLDGKAVIGLSALEIESLGEGDVHKVSRRDLAAVLASRASGATTVAATIYLAAQAGISVMATGGLGGVHRGGEQSLDISADLYELARVPVAVVCAGAKAILDLPRTLEVLETLGVPVVGVGTNEFPAFYSVSSGLTTSHSVASAAEAAELLTAQTAIGLSSGVLFVQPPPVDQALDRDLVESWIERALERAKHEGIQGAAVTPFLLAEVSRYSEGRTIAANVALLEANANLAAGIARHLKGGAPSGE